MDHGTLSEEHVLRLRRMEPADAAELASWARDSAFCTAAGWSQGLPEAELVEFWESVVAPRRRTCGGSRQRWAASWWATSTCTASSRRSWSWAT
ncbi:hypothetical protein [Ruania albidiflava]|uniref:hypothetical protein n=1 Tax=Ruania albidiflava TaxID=366586 RepID=UPI0003B75D5B|nr:hypothetical protein [Ruania albidiflava]